MLKDFNLDVFHNSFALVVSWSKSQSDLLPDEFGIERKNHLRSAGGTIPLWRRHIVKRLPERPELPLILDVFLSHNFTPSFQLLGFLNIRLA